MDVLLEARAGSSICLTDSLRSGRIGYEVERLLARAGCPLAGPSAWGSLPLGSPNMHWQTWQLECAATGVGYALAATGRLLLSSIRNIELGGA